MKRFSFLCPLFFLCGLLVLSARGAIADGVVRTKVAGMDVLVDKTSVRDVVILRGTWPAGDALSPPTNPAIATLVAGMLDKGTTTHGKFALAKLLEDLGASIRFQAGDSLNADFSVSCLKEDLPTVVALLAEELRYPAFDPAEFAKLKQQFAAAMRRQLENTGAQADRAFLRSVYPPGHPNRPASIEEWIAGIDAASLDEVKAFHAAHYGPGQLTLVAAGDVDATHLHALLQQSFGDWSGGSVPFPAMAAAAKVADVPKEQTVFVPGKTSVNVVLGQATGVRYSDPDALALRVGASILGEGFTGRLMKQVREKEGLTYGIYANVQNDMFSDGDWQVTATFAPALLEKGVASARGVLKSFLESGVTADELAARKTSMVGKQQVGLATTGGLASALMATVQRGLPVSYLDEYPAKIEALSVEQVNEALRRRLDADRMILIEAGTIATDTSTPPATGG